MKTATKYGIKIFQGKNFKTFFLQFKGAVARYCACTAMIGSGGWLTNGNHQKRRPATMRMLRDFEVFAGTSCMFENKRNCLVCNLFIYRIKKATEVQQWPVIIAESQCKKTLASFAVKRWHLKY